MRTILIPFDQRAPDHLHQHALYLSLCRVRASRVWIFPLPQQVPATSTPTTERHFETFLFKKRFACCLLLWARVQYLAFRLEGLRTVDDARKG